MIEVKILRWVCGLIRNGEIKNDENIRGTPTVVMVFEDHLETAEKVLTGDI